MFNDSNAIKILTIISLIFMFGCSDRHDNAQQHSTENSQKDTSAITIVNWGPKFTQVDTGFAVQSNGNSAIWFEQRGIERKEDIRIFFDGTELGGVAIIPNGGSAEIPKSLLRKEGKFPIYIILKNDDQVELGHFNVLPKPQ